VNVIPPETPLSPGNDAATRDDREFNETFRQHFTTVGGLPIHNVVGGDGPQPIVISRPQPRARRQTETACRDMERPLLRTPRHAR
jgi:hypothetical protein